MAKKQEKRYVSDNAQLMAEWNWEKNSEVSPYEVTCGSHKKVWWKCNRLHEWQAAVSDRNSGTGCPYCAGAKVLQGYNDLETINPFLAIEWHHERNGGLTSADVMPNSGRKVWWKCSKGHEWQAKIAHRNKGVGCPYCAGRAALGGINDLYTVNPVLSKEWHYERNGELTPADVMPNSGRKVWWKCSKGHEWQAVIANRNKGVGCPICNSESQTSFPEYALVYYLMKNRIEAIHSYKELGYELDVYIPSQKTAIEYDGYYWHATKTKNDLEKNRKCEKDGIKLYRIREGLLSLNDSSIDHIIQKNISDLPDALKRVLSEIIGAKVDIDLVRDMIDIESLREQIAKAHSLALVNQVIAKEWNYRRNANLKPENYTPSSNKKVWWKCERGHEWQARIADRTKGDGCPYCSGHYAVEGVNDLQTLNPNLAKEWNHEKNANLKPENYTPNSNRKVWWKCERGHEWQASIKHRNNGSGCPYCSGRCATEGNNDLQTVNPALAKEWNYKKNNGLTPANFLPNSGKKVWWICEHGHEWEARIADRSKGYGCPYCSGKRVLSGYNDLETINPSLAKEWHSKKNGDLKPVNFTANSHKKVWWECSKKHEWLAEIRIRNKGAGCPFCAKEKRKKQMILTDL